jgi:hypothetical protein
VAALPGLPVVLLMMAVRARGVLSVMVMLMLTWCMFFL